MSRVHTRREWFRLAGGAAVAIAGCGDDWLDVGIDVARDGYDAVLDHLHGTDPELGRGLSNHAPMVMDALAALGREDRVAAWAKRYARQLEVMEPGIPLAPGERAEQLGQFDRHADWIATFEADLATAPPAEVLARNWDALCPGWASVHGVLRVAHAMRALEREDTESRRRELAHGLGYWAARHDQLPGEPGAAPSAGLDVVAALAQVPLVAASRRTGGLIVERLAVLHGDAAFVASIEAVDLDALPIEQAVHELVAAAARLYVAEGSNDISLLHAVTGTAAIPLLLPYLDETGRRRALGHAFQAVAALHAIASRSEGVPDTVPTPAESASTLAALAAERDEEHEIKLGEAALREFAIESRPELLAAAALVLG